MGTKGTEKASAPEAINVIPWRTRLRRVEPMVAFVSNCLKTGLPTTTALSPRCFGQFTMPRLKVLGIDVPAMLLARADEVIE